MVLEQLNTQESAENQYNSNSGDKLIERKEIIGTPFTAINTGEGWFLTLGKYRLTAVEKELHELEEMVISKEWPFLMDVIGVMINEIINEKNK